MDLRLIVIAALVVFDLAIALVTSLGFVAPPVAAGLLLTNPLVLVIEHHLRGRRGASPSRPPRD